MGANRMKFFPNGNYWETAPLQCAGGDVRVRIHKKGPYPVDLLVSIDGEEEYIKYDDFGLDELKSEITLEGTMEGQCVKFRSRSEFTLVKYMEQ
ncbi:MAG: hypothetical protein E7087_03565 [Bacteroidales bacterium]|nr:hypothetical protein [Bacteroidales bacterium]MBO5263510.1 hypothetical protein [Bacteroidaceae bacterium]